MRLGAGRSETREREGGAKRRMRVSGSIGVLPPLRGPFLPTLFRLLLVVALIVGLVYGAMIALVTYVHVQPREITQTVPASKLEKER